MPHPSLTRRWSRHAACTVLALSATAPAPAYAHGFGNPSAAFMLVVYATLTATFLFGAIVRIRAWPLKTLAVVAALLSPTSLAYNELKFQKLPDLQEAVGVPLLTTLLLLVGALPGYLHAKHLLHDRATYGTQPVSMIIAATLGLAAIGATNNWPAAQGALHPWLPLAVVAAFAFIATACTGARRTVIGAAILASLAIAVGSETAALPMGRTATGQSGFLIVRIAIAWLPIIALAYLGERLWRARHPNQNPS